MSNNKQKEQSESSDLFFYCTVSIIGIFIGVCVGAYLHPDEQVAFDKYITEHVCVRTGFVATRNEPASVYKCNNGTWLDSEISKKAMK